MKMHRSQQPRRFRPGVERLEVRDTPTLSVSGGFGAPLMIQALGNTQLNQNHTLSITDFGNGFVLVNADGIGGFFTNVTSITFFGGNKTDSVRYTLLGDLQQTESVSIHLRQGNDSFVGLLQGNIGATSGSTSTPGSLNLNVDHGPGNDTSTLLAAGNVRVGSLLNYSEDFGGNATNTPNTVSATDIVLGNILGTANFNYITGGSTSFANKESLNFFQFGNISGTETVLAKGTTKAPGFIHDFVLFNGTLTGTLFVTENAGSDTTNRATNTLNEVLTLNSGSTGSLTAVENNEPRSLGTENLTINKTTPPKPTISGLLEQAFGSTAITNDPTDVMTVSTP
jgi:hypothetical protein